MNQNDFKKWLVKTLKEIPLPDDVKPKQRENLIAFIIQYFDIFLNDVFFMENIEDIAVRENRDDIKAFIQKLIGKYYPGPTALERIQHIFGELEPGTELKKPYIGSHQRHYIYSGVFINQSTFIQLELPGMEEDNIAEIDKGVTENTDALALKCFHAIFSECYRQHEDWGAWCYYNANTICDLLGYKRDKKGYHQSNNIYQVERRLRMLANLKYKFEVIGYDPKTKADGVVFEGPLIRIEADNTVSLFKHEFRIAKKSVIRIHDILHEQMVKKKMFAWFNKEFLKLNPQKHSRAILLYIYYTHQLAMGRKQRTGPKNVVKRPLETVLRETGIKIDNRVKKRETDNFINAHIELKARGLIKDFSLLLGAEGQIEITFDENHPIISKYKEKQAMEAHSEDES